MSPRTAARELRRRFDDPNQSLEAAEMDHLAEIAGEGALLERWRRTHAALPSAVVEAAPPTFFAQRVLANLPDGPLEMIGWAAIRLLPMAVALALVLSLTYARTLGRNGPMLDLRSETLLIKLLLQAPETPAESGS